MVTLTVHSDALTALKEKKGHDGILLEPSLLVNSFLVRSFDKFGVLKAPDRVKEMILLNPERNLFKSELRNINPIVDIFLRPDHGNVKALFETTLNNIAEDKNIHTTPAAFGMFIQYCIDNELNIDFNVNVQVEMDKLYKNYTDTVCKRVSPIAVERLIKLFSLFYGKDFKKDTRYISKIQKDLSEAEKTGNTNIIKEINFDNFIGIVEGIMTEYCQGFSSNNIFNKLLEELYMLKKMQEEGFSSEYIDETLVLDISDDYKDSVSAKLKKVLGE